MPAKKTAAHAPPKPVDEMSSDEIAKALADTKKDLEAIRKRWRGLVRLTEGAREDNTLGRAIATMAAPLHTLFVLLLPAKGKESPLAKYFEVLADQDHGYDAKRFEADLLLRRLERLAAEQEIHDEMVDLARHFGDDVLTTGADLVETGKKALDMARTLAKSSVEFRTLLAPVLDTLAAMTKKARAAREEQRKAAASSSDGEPASPANESPTNGAPADPPTK